MTDRVVVVRPDDPAEVAHRLLRHFRIDQLPVCRSLRLVGLLTERDLHDAFPCPLEPGAAAGAPSMHVESLMTTRVLTVAPDADLLDAARMMRDERVGALPVLADGKVVGIITRSDMLRALIAVSAAAESASQAV